MMIKRKKLVIVRKFIYIFALLLIIFPSYSGIFKKNKKKYSLALLPFENKTGDASNKIYAMEASSFMFLYLYDKNAFRIIEMQHLGDVTGENLPAWENFDKEAYLKTVKNLGVEVILFGNLKEISLLKTSKAIKSNITLNCRLVRLLTGEVICMKETKVSGKLRLKKGEFENPALINENIQQTLKKGVKKLACSISRNTQY